MIRLSEVQFWILYGTREYIYDELEDELDIRNEEHALALFTSPDKAREFGEACKTPEYDEDAYWRNFKPDKQFKKGTLLHGFQSYCIKPLWQKELLVDPKPPK